MRVLTVTFLFIVLCGMFMLPVQSSAQELHQDLQEIISAEVTEIFAETEDAIGGTDVTQIVQTIELELREGERAGEHIILENDFQPLEEGDKVFLNRLVTIDGTETYSIRDVDRRGTLLLLALLFVGVIILFGGWQGVRSIVSLSASLLAIVYILLPLLMEGYPPVLVSVVVASIILFFAIYFTHGFNRGSTLAFLGTVSAVFLTGLLSYVAVQTSNLTGFSSDETVFLNFTTGGALDFRGLLLGGIIIGVLGVLDDIAVTQVAIVAELRRARADLARRDYFTRAVRVGREHVGALVNTLVLAYAGVSLPLLLLFSGSDASFGLIINQELFATEIIRTIVGSIGLVFAVPFTTLLAVYFLREKDLDREAEHAHGHMH